jgi:hypothetical protein
VPAPSPGKGRIPRHDYCFCQPRNAFDEPRLRHRRNPVEQHVDFLVSLAASIDRFDPGITGFLDNFRDDSVPLRLSVAIVAAGAILLAMLVIWGTTAWWRISRLRRSVRSCGTGLEFAKRFEQVDGLLSRSIFGASWDEYRAVLRRDGGRILYPRPPVEYVGLHAVGQAAFPARLFAASHGYFIGIGLLLTFVGLVAALKFAAAGVASADVAIAKQALNALLSAASFKFMTSIAGLGCSLVLSLAARSMTYVVENSAAKLAQDLESRMVPIVAECVAYDQLAVAREQAAQFEKLNSTLAAAAGRTTSEETVERGRDAVPQMMRELVKEMRSAGALEMRQLASMLGEVGAAIGQTQHHIDRSGQAFADRMSSAASQLLAAAATLRQDVGGRMNAVGDRLDVLAETLAKSETQLTATAANAAQRLAKGVEAAGEEIALRTAEATQGLLATADGLAQRISGMIGGLDGFNAALSSQLESMRQIVSSLDVAKRALDGSAATWARSCDPIVVAVDASKGVAHELGLVADRVAASQNEMSDMARAMTTISEKAAVVWDRYQGRFEKVDEELKAVFMRLEDGTRSFGKEVMEFVGKLDANLAAGTQALAIGTEELREVAEILVANTTAKAA